jgi:hypothetical protein
LLSRETMNLHLQEISTQVAQAAHAVLICDGAGWHQRGKQLEVPANLTPPYSRSAALMPCRATSDDRRAASGGVKRLPGGFGVH